MFLRRQGPRLAGKTIVVHTRRPDDRTIKGIVHATYTDRWVLREAVVMGSGGVQQPLGGDIGIDRENISFWQEIVVTEEVGS